MYKDVTDQGTFTDTGSLYITTSQCTPSVRHSDRVSVRHSVRLSVRYSVRHSDDVSDGMINSCLFLEG